MTNSLHDLVRQKRAWWKKRRHYTCGALVPRAHYVYYEVGVVLPDGTRHRTSGETLREANAKMREYLANARLQGCERSEHTLQGVVGNSGGGQ